MALKDWLQEEKKMLQRRLLARLGKLRLSRLMARWECLPIRQFSILREVAIRRVQVCWDSHTKTKTRIYKRFPKTATAFSLHQEVPNQNIAETWRTVQQAPSACKDGGIPRVIKLMVSTRNDRNYTRWSSRNLSRSWQRGLAALLGAGPRARHSRTTSDQLIK